VPRHAPRGRDALLHRAAIVDFFVIRLFVVLATLEQVVERRHDTDADDVVVKRDVPEPAVLVPGLQHHRRPFIAAGIAIGALPVGPDGALVQDRIPEAQLEPVLQHRGLSGRVDDDLGAHLAAGAARVLDAHADRSIAVEQHVEDVDSLVRIHAVLARVLEHHLVELAAHDLPRLRALMRLVVPEVERRRQLAAGVDELHAVLLHEVAAPHLGQHVQPLQHPVGFRDQRLADVKPWKALALEKTDAKTLLRDERRGRRSCRAAADDDHIVVR
jgi:hypothetical protein